MTKEQQLNLEKARKEALQNYSEEYLGVGDKQIFIPREVPSSMKTGDAFSYIEATHNYWINNKGKFKALIFGKKKLLNIKFTFVRGNNEAFSYAQSGQIIQDIMIKHNWITHDSADYVIPSFGKYQVDKRNAGVIIEVLN
jgi:hypothetical protein